MRQTKTNGLVQKTILIEPTQEQALRELSARTGISQGQMLRDGIAYALRKYSQIDEFMAEQPAIEDELAKAKRLLGK